jgi:hypothetical protein
MFATKEELGSILLGDINTLNEVLSRVYNKGVEDAMKATPELTARLIKSSLYIRDTIEKFKADHPEFAGHEDVVRRVVQEVERESPAATYAEILNKAVPKITLAMSLDKPEPAPTQLSLTDLNNKLLL